MADDLDISDAAQEAVEPDNAPVESAPWGDDFDPQRAWNTIQNLRNREKELEKAAKEYERLTSDPEAYYEHGTRQGWVELEDNTPEEPESFDDPNADLRSKVEQFEQWKEQQEQAAALNAFNADLDKLAAEADVSLTQKQRNLIMVDAINGGWNQDATAKAFNEFVDDLKAYEQQVIERYAASKKAPSPPRPGKQGEAEFDPTDRDARQARMEAIIAASADD